RLQEKREPSRALSSFRLCRLPDALATFEAGETPDCDVFAKGCNFFLDYLLHRAVRILDEGLLQQADFLEELLEAALDDLVDDALGLAFIESRGPVDAPLLLQHRRRHVLTGHILGASRRHLHGQVASQLAELLRLGDEVRFAVDLDQHTDAAAGMDVGLNQALGRHASRLLGRCSQALLPQIGDGLLHIAAGLLQGPLAVHHAGLGSLPQLLDHLRRYLRHPYVLLPKSNLDKLFRFALRILLRLGLGLSPSLSLLPALLAFQDRVGDLAGQQAHGPDSIIVARNDEIDLIRVAVGVHDGDDRDAQLPGLVDCDLLFARVDDKQRVRQAGHVADAAQVALELVLLLAQPHNFLLGQPLKGPVGLHLLQFLKALDAGLDGLEVGQHAAQPALVDVVHPAAL